MDKKEDLEEINYHYEIAQLQKKTYNNLRSDPDLLGENTILIDVDYKQKIYFGLKSPRQQSKEYYQYGSCSCLGFGIYFINSRENKTTNKIEKFVDFVFIDLLSEDTSQTASDYINGFRFLRSLDIFKSIEKENYIIYSDTAKIFRCQEVCHFFFKELADLNIRVSINFFGEYHGKVTNIILI